MHHLGFLTFTFVGGSTLSWWRSWLEPPCEIRDVSRVSMSYPIPPPEFSSRREKAAQNVRKLDTLGELLLLARLLKVSTPVPTVRCVRQDILTQIAQLCTDSRRIKSATDCCALLRSRPDSFDCSPINGTPRSLP